MSVNREDLKRMIDFIHEEDAVEVYDFIGFLNMKRASEALGQIDIDLLSKDHDLIHQIQKSRKDRKNGRIFDKEQGLKFLQRKVGEFEREQNI